MNRIETRIIISVTNQLAAAKDSDAKSEMIEELSENLYQRYLELVSTGVPEGEAFHQAMDSLGDVQELLDYLREEEENTAQDAAEGWEDAGAGNGENTKYDWQSSLEDIVNAAISAAKTAGEITESVARDVSEQVKRKYPDGIWEQFHSPRGEKVDCQAIAADRVSSVEIHLTNGDIRLCSNEEGKDALTVMGDTQEIETILQDNGTLCIRQGNTASSSFFFTRGIRHSDIEVWLPKKVWEKISATSVNGDVEISDPLECREVVASTTNGDVRTCEITGERIRLKSVSGDVSAENLSGNLKAESKSGDVEVSAQGERMELKSVSGDIRFVGQAAEIACTSSSGDVTVRSRETVPQKAKVSSISGDCRMVVPKGQGFSLSYHTVSGDFMANLPFTGTFGAKSGEVAYGDPICGQLQISSVSGDIKISDEDV